MLPAVGRGRQHGNLRYVAETNDRAPHPLGSSLSGFSFAHEPAFLSCTLAHHCDAESPAGAAWPGGINDSCVPPGMARVVDFGAHPVAIAGKSCAVGHAPGRPAGVDYTEGKTLQNFTSVAGNSYNSFRFLPLMKRRVVTLGPRSGPNTQGCVPVRAGTCLTSFAARGPDTRRDRVRQSVPTCIE